METGWRYRLVSVLGVAILTAVGVGVVNNGTVQTAVTSLPVLSRLPANPPSGVEFSLEVLVTVAVVTGAFLPLYKPRPRRILDIIALAHKRVLVAVFALATIGYFDYTYKLPRLTLVLMTPILLTVLPLWFVWLRQPDTQTERAVVVGDDIDAIRQVIETVDIQLLGSLCSTSTLTKNKRDDVGQVISDGAGAVDIDRLGGLSRLEDVLVNYDIDTVVLAFAKADRAEFFGALDACYEHGVDAKVHRDHADAVLSGGGTAGSLVDVEIEPWDVQDYLWKRAFDVVFSLVGLLVLLPVVAGIAVAIKLEDGGPILYSQERTAVFGETFTVFKFRTMSPDGESPTPVNDEENDRITRVGRVLRRTHLDEIPQLWSILRGDMSVVGPRAVWTEEEHLLEEDSEMWRKRWFVKPGLTGLAQINDASSLEPAEKLRYDLQYVREQSLQYDLKIVARQLWKVAADVWKTLFEPEDS